MVFAFKFPDLGEGIHEGKIVKWLVADGDAVKADQIIAEVETDKAVVELPSPASGTILKRYFGQGQVVQVGKVVVAIGSPGEAAPEQEAEAEKQAPPGVEHAKVVSLPPSQAHHFEGEVHKLHVTVHGERQVEEKPRQVQPAGSQLVQPPATVPAKQVQPAGSQPVQQPSLPLSPPVLVQPVAVSQPVQALQFSKQASQPSLPATPGQVLATPATRALARELGVELAQVKGSGPGGRVMPEDVKRQAEMSKGGGTVIAGQVQLPSSTQTSPASTGALQQTQAALSTPSNAIIPSPTALPLEFQYPKLSLPSEAIERVPLSPIRKAIVQKMVESKRWIPHVTHFDEADITRLEEIRQSAKKQLEEEGVKLTMLSFIAKAVVNALQNFPEFNSTLDYEKQELVLKKYYNLGFAVDTPEGLMVVVVKDAQSKGIMEFAREIPALAEKARGRKASLDEIRGGTFTITNIGSVGGVGATPIINFPESAILGVFRAKDKPVVADGKIVVRKIMPLAVSFDHRIIDGAKAARFLGFIVQQLEDPTLL